MVRTDKQTSRDDSARWIVQFTLADQLYSLPREAVDEIVQMAELVVPPRGPRILAGFLVIGEEFVPVIRTSELFGAAEQQVGLYTPLIVLRGERIRFAIQVDRIATVSRVPPHDLLPIPAGHSFNECATGMVRIGTETSLLLAADRLMLEEERLRVSELRSIEQARVAAVQEANR